MTTRVKQSINHHHQRSSKQSPPASATIAQLVKADSRSPAASVARSIELCVGGATPTVVAF
jgi:hypothetical protein